MKKNIVLALLALAGAAIGYGVGNISGVSGFSRIADIVFGAFLTWQLGRAFFEKYYIAIIAGPILGLLISIGSDLLAGSEVVARGKLMYMVMGLFAAWPYGKVREPYFVGSIVGGVIGFIWGLNDSRWFGNALVQPGILNASLMAVQVAMMGLCIARIIAEGIEQKWAFKKTRHPERSRRAFRQRK